MSEQRDGWSKVEVVSKIVSALFLPIVLLWLGTWFNDQQKKNEEIKNSAERSANRLTTMLKSLASDNPRERLLATKVMMYFGTHDQLPSELVPALVEIAAGDPNKEVSDSAFQSLTTAAQTDRKLAPTIEKALGALPARVYIQIAGPTQRAKAKQIQQELIDHGMLVPGIEDVSGKADIPKNTNVRYFNDQDKATAETVVGILHSNGIASAYPYRVSGRSARPGILEIWFSRND